jgi:hypothetical protein
MPNLSFNKTPVGDYTYPRTSEKAINCQPSDTTKKASLKGSATTAGGTIIMPIDIKIADTTKSIIKKGKKNAQPI